MFMQNALFCRHGTAEVQTENTKRWNTAMRWYILAMNIFAIYISICGLIIDGIDAAAVNSAALTLEKKPFSSNAVY